VGKVEIAKRFASLVFFQASFPLPRLAFYKCRRRAIGFCSVQDVPCDACQLVSYCYDKNITVRSAFELAHPLAYWVIISIQTHNDGARTVYE
jgi:hypothetical protein